MRTMPALLLLSLSLAVPARAQFPTSLGQTGDGKRMTADRAAPSTPLPIPLPPGAAVQMEMDGKDSDLLGMVKGLLAGAATPKKGSVADAVASNPFLALLGDGQLTALLRDIHHLHVVSFKPAADAAGAAPTDFLAFYEAPFEAEGGHRLLYITQGSQVVTVGFDQPRGFAAAIHSGDTVYVVRADGYPDMAVVGSLLRTFGAAVPSLSMPTPAPAPVHPARKPAPKPARARARKA